MDWLEIALIAAAILGIAAGGFLVARSPTFWVGVGTALIKAAAPYIIAYLTKRMTPEKEAEFRKAIRSGQDWDPFRKRARTK